MNRSISLIIFLVIWIMLLIGLKRNRMHFFVFLVGSLGFFSLNMIFFSKPLESGLSTIMSMLLNGIGEVTHLFTVYPQHSILLQKARDGIVTIMINYECSGIIEMLIFISLAIFFPFIKGYKKILVSLSGGIFIIVANIIRIMSILIIVKVFGIYSYNFAHNVVARIIFFVLMIILYYHSFTKVQIRKQKVGDIR